MSDSKWGTATPGSQAGMVAAGPWTTDWGRRIWTIPRILWPGIIPNQ